jgi:peptidoglycan LD-endopeptidase LytH
MMGQRCHEAPSAALRRLRHAPRNRAWYTAPWCAVLVAVACSRGTVQTAPAPASAEPAAPVTETTPAGTASPEVGALLLAKSLMVPVSGVDPLEVRDTYSASRGERGLHAALDIMAPRGTPIVSADSGRVWKIRSNTLGGRTVYALDAGEHFVYYYAHLDRYADGLKEGMPLLPGDVIGYVGTTGNAPPDTPHLHFQVMRYRGDGRWWNLEPVDPFPFLLREGRVRAP